ncbi:MAG: hypothetical protein QM811_20520 [Pirellulales bacterium]
MRGFRIESRQQLERHAPGTRTVFGLFDERLQRSGRWGLLGGDRAVEYRLDRAANPIHLQRTGVGQRRQQQRQFGNRCFFERFDRGHRFDLSCAARADRLERGQRFFRLGFVGVRRRR